MGIVESEAALSDQLKEVEELVADKRGSEGGEEKGRDSETVGIVGSVCVDMVAEEVEEMITGLVWTAVEVVMVGSVWVAALTLDARADSQRSHSSRIPASWKS